MEKYWQWRHSRLQEKYKKEREFWSNDCIHNSQKVQSLEDKVQALQAELKTAKESESELMKELKICKDNNKKLVQNKAALEESIEINNGKNKQIKLRLEQKLAKTEEDHEKMVTQLKQKFKETALSKQAAFDNRLSQNCEETESLIKEQEQRYQRKLEECEKQYHKKEQEYKREVENLKKQMLESEEARGRYDEEEREKKEAFRYETILKRKSLETKIQALQMTIKEMKNKEDINQKASVLQNIVQHKIQIIENKNIELTSLKKDKQQLQDSLCRESDKNAILVAKLNNAKDTCKRLEEEKREEHSKLKETKAELNKANRAKLDLNDTVARLKYKVKASEPEISKLRAKISKLETDKLRFKADLEALSMITETKKLNSRIITLKRRYIDDNEQVGMNECTEAAYQQQVVFLKKSLDCCLRAQQNNSRSVKREKEYLENKAEHLDKTTSYYIRLLNEKIVEVQNLKKELKDTNLQLQKATKPAQERVRSWINKKVRSRIAQVAPEVAEETPSLYPDDWQPPGLPDETITSVHSCSDGMVSASLQPHPCTDASIVLVKPFDGLPPVDI
ncbi:MAG: hypothetical protein ACRC31_01470 [Cetobacterium sp.]